MFPELKADYIISNQQINQFWQDGFILLKEVLKKDEINYYGNNRCQPPVQFAFHCE